MDSRSICKMFVKYLGCHAVPQVVMGCRPSWYWFGFFGHTLGNCCYNAYIFINVCNLYKWRSKGRRN
ncbi:hypothetical protein X975_18506, partial [Stegodyphus mimosarum]